MENEKYLPHIVSSFTYVVDRPDEPWEKQPITDMPSTTH
jgi:hypothetical protein